MVQSHPSPVPPRPLLSAAEEEQELALLRSAYGYVPPPPRTPSNIVANDVGSPAPGLAKTRPRPRRDPAE